MLELPSWVVKGATVVVQKWVGFSTTLSTTTITRITKTTVVTEDGTRYNHTLINTVKGMWLLPVTDPGYQEWLAYNVMLELRREVGKVLNPGVRSEMGRLERLNEVERLISAARVELATLAPQSVTEGEDDDASVLYRILPTHPLCGDH